MRTDITLIIPVYNVEKYLNQCLDSVVEQTEPFDEVILINDGSTDQSLSICREYVEKYKYFKLIDQENKGLSIARNMGMSFACSEYIMFLDSDDFLRRDTVRILKDRLTDRRADAIYFDAATCCDTDWCCAENAYDRSAVHLDEAYISGWDFFKKVYPKYYIVSACMAVYKRKQIDNIKLSFPEGLYYEDNYFSFMFLIQAEKVTYLSEKLYQRRYRDNSITTGRYTERKFLDHVKIVLLMWKSIICKNFLDIPGRKELLLRFINDQCTFILNSYKLCQDQGIAVGEEAHYLLNELAEQYILTLRDTYLGKERETPLLINRMEWNLEQIMLYHIGDKSGHHSMLQKVRERKKQCYRYILDVLPLNVEGYKIGIYGTGEHTRSFLNAFELLIGKITCSLLFIDTYKEKGTYRGRKIINYQQIDETFDLIIISSFIHQQDMIDCVKSVNKEISIYTFYDNSDGDIFSGLRWIEC